MFSDTDFQPFNTFELCWRWTEHRTNIPTEHLNKIKPLSSAKANGMWRRSLDFVEGQLTVYPDGYLGILSNLTLLV